MEWRHMTGSRQNFTFAGGDPEKIGTEPAPQVDSAEQQGHKGPYADDVSPTASDASTKVELPLIDHKDSAKLEIEHKEGKPLKEEQKDASGSKLAEAPTATDGESVHSTQYNFWALIRQRLQRPLSEWLGTTVLMFIGISCNLSVITSRDDTGNQLSQYWCWGLAVMLAIYISGGGSGAFLNPALTIMLSLFRGVPARRVPVYIIAQVFGAYCGALLAFAVYYDDIYHFDGALLPDGTGVAFYTQPKDWVRPVSAFFTEVLGTAVIACAILAFGDSWNSPPGAGMHALIIGLLTTTVCMALGYSTGGTFNPARDFGPRLAAISVGYPASLFTSHQNWWIWGPWCATISGACLGGLVYDVCIFKGGESPINYSLGRWETAGMRTGRDLSTFFGMRRRSRDLEKQIERKLDKKCDQNVEHNTEKAMEEGNVAGQEKL